ncbi:MAG: family 16 glycosylhydrolase [Bacteroidota bacterium]
MKYFKTSLLLVTVFFLTGSCTKAGGGGGATQGKTPSNLMITANVSVDGRGNVAFTARADDAVSYAFEFGNGVVTTVASGIISHQYTLAGSNTYNVTVTASGSTGLTIKKTVPVTVTVQGGSGTQTLFWSEEFNVDGAPDATKWGYDIGTGGNGWGNNELEYYTSRPENVIVQNGVLKITAKKENYMGSAYTSTRLLSQNKFAFTYGRVEVRAKIPAGVGTWPAIWMLGSNIATVPWPACGELDIMEHRGSELNKIFGTLHYPGRSGGNADGNTKVISNATTEFHKYSMDWSATAIKIYVDDMLIHSVNNSAAIPFNHDFFFILNVAMGGSFAGAVDPAVTSATMEVDYVRVYK